MIHPSYTSNNQSDFFNLGQARWVTGILAMLIAVVGKESLLGLILGQTRREIMSVVRAEEEGEGPAADPWHLSN